ncbi:MAG: guanylate kinase [Ruminococcus sp.]|nr:guanylate kinase [Ruminococcus sp.]
MSKKGCLVIISGFSGAGKGTVVKKMMADYDCYALSISATTRSPRPGETNGKEYFFKTKEEFEELIAQDALYEYAQYVSNYYGTPKAYVQEQLQAGKDVILEIEVQGALNVKEKNPEALLLFITPPTAEELRNRLVGRGTETMEVINDRMNRAAEEAKFMNRYDYLVINDNLDACVEEVHQLIQREHLKMEANQDMVAKIQKELNEMKGE